MEDKAGSGKNISNDPHDMDELAKELDSMSVEELKEELEILLSEMDEDSFDGDLLDVYLDAIDRKDPQPQYVDAQTSYKLFLKRLKAREREGMKRRGFRGALKAGIIAAAIAALLAGTVAVAYARGIDLFGRIARWTVETFGFSSSAGTAGKAGAELPPQLQGMKEALEQGGIGANLLPAYWPEGYEQSRITSSDNPEMYTVTGAYGENGNYIVLSYLYFQSGTPEPSYSIDEEKYPPYVHNGIRYYVTTNEGGYLAVWYQGSVEGSLSGVSSYEELIKILDSIGG